MEIDDNLTGLGSNIEIADVAEEAGVDAHLVVEFVAELLADGIAKRGPMQTDDFSDGLDRIHLAAVTGSTSGCWSRRRGRDQMDPRRWIRR